MSRKKASTHMILENRTLLTMKSRMSTNSSNDDDGLAQNRGNLKKRRGQNDSKDFSQTSILDPEAPIDVSSLS